MLIIFGGLPGVGKSSIAQKLAEKLKAVYLRIDSIEQAIKNAPLVSESVIQVNTEEYMVAYAIAHDNLALGLTVITDSVNSSAITRADFRKVAQGLNKPYLEIEIICSDIVVHQQRVELRTATIKGLKLPNWEKVCNRDYELWDTRPFVIDSHFMDVDEAVSTILAKMKTSIP